jgi:hypothetical protein
MGHAVLTVGEQKVSTDENWAVAAGLEPDRAYAYEVAVGGKKIGDGKVRTYPEHAVKMTFFVIGDYGNGTLGQTKIAQAMWKEYQRLVGEGEPVRFVLTLGDNIYSDLNLGIRAVHSGDDDADWEQKFFHPYEPLLKEVPFYPTLGNHDGNGSENRGDLFAYLDNFFFPQNRPTRWYEFHFADLADFFALDSTNNSESGGTKKVYLPNGEEFSWFQKAISEAKAPWKIPYFHHPIYNAGPYHGASYGELKHFVQVFEKTGVKVVFNGHEHNFQYSEAGPNTAGIRYVVSGAGGELRDGDVRRKMQKAHIEGWAPQRHFLVVRIEGKEMRIAAVGDDPVKPKDSNGREIALPLAVHIP